MSCTPHSWFFFVSQQKMILLRYVYIFMYICIYVYIWEWSDTYWCWQTKISRLHGPLHMSLCGGVDKNDGSTRGATLEAHVQLAESPTWSKMFQGTAPNTFSSDGQNIWKNLKSWFPRDFLFQPNWPNWICPSPQVHCLGWRAGMWRHRAVGAHAVATLKVWPSIFWELEI